MANQVILTSSLTGWLGPIGVEGGEKRQVHKSVDLQKKYFFGPLSLRFFSLPFSLLSFPPSQAYTYHVRHSDETHITPLHVNCDISFNLFPEPFNSFGKGQTTTNPFTRQQIQTPRGWRNQQSHLIENQKITIHNNNVRFRRLAIGPADQEAQ